MSAGRQLFYALAVLLIVLLFNEGLAAVNTDNSISNLYENLLQREYAGPVVFPNHQVERKAQRSPSLRLRFGRSDPDMLPSAQKRWFGDVHQKPIRSPSLRLRFGRRSDPSMPLHSNFDELMNAAAASGAAVALPNGVGGGVNGDYIDDDSDFNVAAFERVLRKPQRLRWGRSVMPMEGGGAAAGNGADENRQADNLLEEENERQRSDEYINALLNTEKLRSMLLALRNIDEDILADTSGEFQREVRRPGPLRLRWGRSTGGRSSSTTASVAAASEDQKDNSVEHVVNTAAEKDKNKA